MAITATQIEFRLSTTATSVGNATLQDNVDNSLGGMVSQSTIQAATLNNLFDDVSGDDNAALDEEFRAFFVYNSNQTLNWEMVKVWISATVAGGAVASISLDSIGTTPVGYSAGSQMLVVPDEDTAPTALVFSHPLSKGAGLTIGTMTPLSVQGVWIRRVATNSAALNDDGLTISFEGDTGA